MNWLKVILEGIQAHYGEYASRISNMENIVSLLLRRTKSLIQERKKKYCFGENHDHSYAKEKEVGAGSHEIPRKREWKAKNTWARNESDHIVEMIKYDWTWTRLF